MSFAMLSALRLTYSLALLIMRMISITKVYFTCDSTDLISFCCSRFAANSIK